MVADIDPFHRVLRPPIDETEQRGGATRERPDPGPRADPTGRGDLALALVAGGWAVEHRVHGRKRPELAAAYRAAERAARMAGKGLWSD